MSRVGVVLLLAGLAIAGQAAAYTKTPTATKTSKTSKTKTASKAKATSKSKAKSKSTKSVAKSKSKSSKRKKTRTKAGRKVALADVKPSSNDQHMPNGFSWPPNEMMKAASVACEQNLDGLGLTWERATPEGKIVDPVYVPAMELGGIKYTPAYSHGPTRMDCQLVQTLAAIGPDLYALGVREVRYGSVYRNTNVRVHGSTLPYLSRHALGIAMDIKAFVDDKGRVANVELDYLKGDPLLHGIEDAVNATHKFRIVLTPGNDPLSHYDHFHIEAAVDFTAFR